MLNGLCVPKEEAVIPAVTSGLYYGAGCFETLVAENSRIFRFQDHIDRLNRGLKYLGVSDAYLIDDESILQEIKSLLSKNDLNEKRSRIRIQASLAEKGGYSKRNGGSIIVIISTKLAEKKAASKKLILSSTCVTASSARPANLKLSNMLHYKQAYREAEEKGADDAVMKNISGFVAETSIANIFWMKDQLIYTPSSECDILPGIMRNSIIRILRNKLMYEVKEGKFQINELMNADSVWLTNSVVEFIPVSKIDNVLFEMNHHFFSGLREKLNEFKKMNMKDV